MNAESPATDLRRFAAAVAHELRTPLAAMSVEVEVALRRERSPAAYREVLSRIGALVEELVDLTGDLAAFNNPGDPQVLRSQTARLHVCLDGAGCQVGGHVSLVLDTETCGRVIAGDEALLTRAFTLLVDHAVHHRPDGALVRLRSMPVSDDGADDDSIVLVIDATPGFPVDAWAPLVEGSSQASLSQAAMLRLTIAARMIAGCGGSVDARSSNGSTAVHIRLRAAVP